MAQIKSMTGYGSAKGECGGLKMSLEIRSVNNRYLDCGVKLPRNFLFAEEIIRNTVKERVSRGKIDIFVTVDASASDELQVSVNEGLAKSYVEALLRLSEVTGVPFDGGAVSVGRFPDVLSVEKKEVDRELYGDFLRILSMQALDEFDAMRMKEGEKLSGDISSRLKSVSVLVEEIDRISPETVKAYQERLYKKLRETLDTSGIDPQRILTEAAIFADKIAVDEETVRLRSHIAQLQDMLLTGSPIGRKMDFLMQEFNREANTIGSKCSDGDVAKIVIELKSEIEKIREQVQNIE